MSDCYSGSTDDLGQPHGEGTFTWSDGTRFEGTFTHGTMSRGRFYMPNGNRYYGSFHHGKRWGVGTFVWHNGDVYEGSFVEGRLNGYGTYWYASTGDKYEGEWRDGKRHGPGVAFLAATGSFFHCMWGNNQPREGTWFNAKGHCYEGTFLNKNMHGMGIYTWPNGRTKRARFKRGTIDEGSAKLLPDHVVTWSIPDSFLKSQPTQINQFLKFQPKPINFPVLPKGAHVVPSDYINSQIPTVVSTTTTTVTAATSNTSSSLTPNQKLIQVTESPPPHISSIPHYESTTTPSQGNPSTLQPALSVSTMDSAPDLDQLFLIEDTQAKPEATITTTASAATSTSATATATETETATVATSTAAVVTETTTATAKAAISTIDSSPDLDQLFLLLEEIGSTVQKQPQSTLQAQSQQTPESNVTSQPASKRSSESMTPETLRRKFTQTRNRTGSLPKLYINDKQQQEQEQEKDLIDILFSPNSSTRILVSISPSLAPPPASSPVPAPATAPVPLPLPVPAPAPAPVPSSAPAPASSVSVSTSASAPVLKEPETVPKPSISTSSSASSSLSSSTPQTFSLSSSSENHTRSTRPETQHLLTSSQERPDARRSMLTPIPSQYKEVLESYYKNQKRMPSVHYGFPLPNVMGCLEDLYELQHLLGEGVSSKVFLGKHKKTEEYFAIKVIPRRILINNHELAREVKILKQMQHPNVIRLVDVFVTNESLQIVMELAEGGELFEEIVSRRNFSEKDAREIVKMILEGLAYIHNLDIVHRDLKPENLIWTEDPVTGKMNLKIIDFGFARNCQESGLLLQSAPVGTLGYKAPEIIKQEAFSTKADMWSLGVITYVLLCGFPPFFSCSEYKDIGMLMNAPFWVFFNEHTDELVSAIKAADYAFPEAFWEAISCEAKDFVQRLLKVLPAERMAAQEALAHPWITGAREKQREQQQEAEEQQKFTSLDIIKKYQQVVRQSCFQKHPAQ